MEHIFRLDKCEGNIVVELHIGGGGGNVTSELKAVCPFCNLADCYLDCDYSVAGEELHPGEGESEEEVASRGEYNAAIDGIESLILACACEGIDIAAAPFQRAVQTAIEGCANNL